MFDEMYIVTVCLCNSAAFLPFCIFNKNGKFQNLIIFMILFKREHFVVGNPKLKLIQFKSIT